MGTIKSADAICKRNCALDDRQVCVGCGRSVPEILEWHRAKPERKDEIRYAATIRLGDRRVQTALKL